MEQTLLEGGRTAAVIQQRMEFQEVMRDRFIAVSEQATGRPVVGFMSGNQQDPDMICEVFVLAPTELVRHEDVPTRPTGVADSSDDGAEGPRASVASADADPISLNRSCRGRQHHAASPHLSEADATIVVFGAPHDALTGHGS